MTHAAGSLGLADAGLTGAVGTTYNYTVSAVDWKGNRSPVTIPVKSVDANSVQPLPASNLQGQVVDSKARLTWVASPTAGVLGYQVYQTIGTDTKVFTTATATLDVPQGWNSTAYYQVKPYVGGGVLLRVVLNASHRPAQQHHSRCRLVAGRHWR